MTDYLHGVETKREEQPASIQDATTSINAMVVSVPTFLLKEEYQTLNKPFQSVVIAILQNMPAKMWQDSPGMILCIQL